MSDYDFTILSDPEVAAIAQRAADYIGNQYGLAYLDADDLHQEAALILARGARRVREHLAAGDFGLIAKELQRDLLNLVQPERNRASRNMSRERLMEGVTE